MVAETVADVGPASVHTSESDSDDEPEWISESET